MQRFAALKCGFITIATVTIVLFVLGMFFALEKATVTVRSAGQGVYYSDLEHPASLFFADMYDTPAIMSDDPYYSTLIDIFQSSYRAYGIRSGLLEPNLCVEFNQEVFKKAVLSSHQFSDNNLSTANDFARLFVALHPSRNTFSREVFVISALITTLGHLIPYMLS